MVLVIVVMVLFLCLMTFVALPRIARAESDLAVMTGAAELSLIQCIHRYFCRAFFHLK